MRTLAEKSYGCVRVRARARVRECARACVRVCVCVRISCLSTAQAHFSSLSAAVSLFLVFVFL